MKIKFGFNRMVFVFENYTIKVARFYFFRTFVRVLTLRLVSEENREKFFLNFGRTPRKYIPRYILCGLVCNRREYKYSKKYPTDSRINPSIKMYFFGLFLIQKSGKFSTEEEFALKNPFRFIKHLVSYETYIYFQFCMFEDGMKLVDYGSILTIKDLLRTKGL